MSKRCSGYNQPLPLSSQNPSLMLEYQPCSGRAKQANYSPGTRKEAHCLWGVSSKFWCGTICCFWNKAVNFWKVKLTSVTVPVCGFWLLYTHFLCEFQGQYVGAVSFKAKILIITVIINSTASSKDNWISFVKSKKKSKSSANE